MIAIIKKNFQEAMVAEHVLDGLITAKKLIAFHRSGEWVVIGKDPVRAKNTLFSGKERRRIIHGNDFCMK